MKNADSKCGNCEHFQGMDSSSFGRCQFPLPKWLFGVIGTTNMVHQNDSDCPVFEAAVKSDATLAEMDK